MPHFVLKFPLSQERKKIIQSLKRYRLRIDCQIEDVEQNIVEIYGFARDMPLLQKLREQLPVGIILEVQEQMQVDWQEQWQQHAPYYTDGIMHLPVGHGGAEKVILLAAGAGFGDYSHPTTRLALRLMQKYAHAKNILDIGTGSGILAIAAIALGSQQAVGIDIDPAALTHAQQNIKINAMEPHITLYNANELPALDAKETCIVMNMLPHEQSSAYLALPQQIRSHAKEWITSGVLTEKKQEYLVSCEQLGWQCVESCEEDIWSGFYFQQQNLI